MEAKLTQEQLEALAPYERNFEQAVKAAWCSYPGQAGIDTMLDVWRSLTGIGYPYQPGCPNCLLNLVRDIGTIYFAQKDSVQAEQAEIRIMPDVGDYKPGKMVQKPAQEDGNTAEGKTTQPNAKKPAKQKAGGKKTK